MKRYAIVTNAHSRSQLENYLPGNYEVIHEAFETTQPFGDTTPGRTDRLVFVIGGTDSFGWGLDSYVIPRLATGLIYANEIDLSHPVMKSIEDEVSILHRSGATRPRPR